MSRKTPILCRIFFKKAGPPRGYFVRNFLTQEMQLKSGIKLLYAFPGFRRSFERALPKPVGKRYQQYAENASVDFSNFSEIVIVTPPQTSFIAQLLAAQLTQLGVVCRTVANYSADAHDPTALYIVFSLFHHETLPPASQRIAFQVEQKEQTHYFTPLYLAGLNESLAVIDYSRENIEFLRNLDCVWLSPGELLIKRIFFYPIAPMPQGDTYADREGILFYGAMTPYRSKILDELKKTHDIEVVTDLFGQALKDKLARAKVVLNIHRSQRAILETTRVSECLSFGARVVSEDVVNQGEFPELEELIDFAPAGDIDALSEALNKVLRTPHDQTPEVEALYQSSLLHLVEILDDLGIPYQKSAVASHDDSAASAPAD
ncbi:glycosyltransferase [Celeribacter neptunius]|uniref:Spore protein YkvP/CgeB glycosyl transferase-like domain-containing protein n=1 Tax=Celeribacter neptunius TaxID=588602 RepID=A0A1I3THX9_9RHOB|nr:glycosyltransferase [Celeribacter neptunius]SFJ69127.1 hypothetical protein SAMN04487991_2685 [Celeribacter neptunius]